MSLARRGLGQTGERLAVRLLEREGLAVRQTNYRCPAGEIDIIAQDGDCLVFVEVKTRRGDGFGLPEDAITDTKRRHLVAASETFLAAQPVPPANWRIDLVAVEMTRDGRLLRVERIENAVEG
jgi:putative endonuclease